MAVRIMPSTPLSNLIAVACLRQRPAAAWHAGRLQKGDAIQSCFFVLQSSEVGILEDQFKKWLVALPVPHAGCAGQHRARRCARWANMSLWVKRKTHSW